MENEMIENVLKENERRKTNINRRQGIAKMLNPETYVQMAMAEINAEPNSHDPKIFHDILHSVICSAMSVWSHDGHMLYLDDSRVIKCLNCGKVFKSEKSVPTTKMCNHGRMKI